MGKANDTSFLRFPALHSNNSVLSGHLEKKNSIQTCYVKNLWCEMIKYRTTMQVKWARIQPVSSRCKAFLFSFFPFQLVQCVCYAKDILDLKQF